MTAHYDPDASVGVPARAEVERRLAAVEAEEGDVIERPILDDYDVNGWDLRKALRLLLKSNPPLYEWLCSPVAYRDRDGFRAALAGLAEASYSLRRVGHHYRQTALLHD